MIERSWCINIKPFSENCHLNPGIGYKKHGKNYPYLYKSPKAKEYSKKVRNKLKELKIKKVNEDIKDGSRAIHYIFVPKKYQYFKRKKKDLTNIIKVYEDSYCEYLEINDRQNVKNCLNYVYVNYFQICTILNLYPKE